MRPFPLSHESINPKNQYLRKVSGYFYRTIPAEGIDRVLTSPAPESAGRYHRPGQPILYMSPMKEWSIRAVAGYMRTDGIRRVVIPLYVDEAFVVDQTDDLLCSKLGISRERSNQPWIPALQQKQEPPSWKNSDLARLYGADGIIDCSRLIPGGWHLNLFRWNEPGAPTITVCGDPIEFRLSDDGGMWDL